MEAGVARLEDATADDVRHNGALGLDPHPPAVHRAVGNQVGEELAGTTFLRQVLQVDVRPAVARRAAPADRAQEGVVAQPDAMPGEAARKDVRRLAITAAVQDQPGLRSAPFSCYDRQVGHLGAVEAFEQHASLSGDLQSRAAARAAQPDAAAQADRLGQWVAALLDEHLAALIAHRVDSGLDGRIGGRGGLDRLVSDTGDSAEDARIRIDNDPLIHGVSPGFIP